MNWVPGATRRPTDGICQQKAPKSAKHDKKKEPYSKIFTESFL